MLFQIALFLRRGRSGGIDNGLRKSEDLAEPKLEPEGQIVQAMLQRESRVAR